VSYVLDTSGLVGAWQRRYPPEVFTTLWDNLEALGAQGELLVPEEVHRELKSKSDELFAWVDARSDVLLAPTTRALLITARTVLKGHPRLSMTGTGRGLADPFVIAQAELAGVPIITEEAGGSLNKPRIPFVCTARAQGVVCMDMLGLIRAEGWSFR